jgi:hypothetical protein
MAKMRAVQVARAGGPLELVEREMPEPSPHRQRLPTGAASLSAIFLSHSSADKDATLQIHGWLESQGYQSTFLDFDPAKGVPAGRDWERELYAQLRASRAVIVLCSRFSMASRWCFVEITHARALGKALFPVKVGDCEIEAPLQTVQVVDLTVQPEEGLYRLSRGLKAAGLDPAGCFDWDGSRPPYPGLLAFEEPDAPVFFRP